MNDTKWSFEYETLAIKEKRRVDDLEFLLKVVRNELVMLLGLNLLPLEDPETGLLRRPGENEFVPLSIMTAREGFVEAFLSRNEEFMQQEKAAEDLEKEAKSGESEMMSADELDKFMQEDITFLDNPEELNKYAAWTTPESQWVQNNVVKKLDDEVEEKKEERPKLLTVKIESEPDSSEKVVSKSKRRVVIAPG